MPGPLVALAASTALGLAKNLAGSVSDALDPSKAKTKATAQDFESVFLEQAFDRLTSSQSTDGPLGENGPGGGVYRSLLVKEIAGRVSKAGGVGIADQVYKELLKLQEGAHGR